MLPRRLGLSLWALRAAFGVLAIASGVSRLGAPGTVGHVAGGIEVAVGVLVLSPFTAAAANFLAGWLVLLALSGLAGGSHLDIAGQDLLLSAGAFSLARLTRVNEAEPLDAAASAKRTRTM